jgi:hypothetical protein
VGLSSALLFPQLKRRVRSARSIIRVREVFEAERLQIYFAAECVDGVLVSGKTATADAGSQRDDPSCVSNQGEQSLHQLAVGPGQGFEDREMVGPVNRQQMAPQSAFDPRLGVINRLTA